MIELSVPMLLVGILGVFLAGGTFGMLLIGLCYAAHMADEVADRLYSQMARPEIPAESEPEPSGTVYAELPY